MTTTLFFLPILAQVLLVLLLYIKLGQVKKTESDAGNVDEARRALHADAWPETVQQVNNCIRNQFEVPVLFYVLMLTLWSVQAVNLIVIAFAWAFVISRYIHAYIHTGSNFVPKRRKVFTIGVMLLLAMLLYTVVAVFLAP